MKFNMGCGHNFLPGYVNVDKFGMIALGAQTVQFDLETFTWPWLDGVAEEVIFNHSLEHMGQSAEVFCRIMQELYRICADDALVQINVPHPRHDDFLNDPTHVRAITPELLGLFSQANCRTWQIEGAANSPLAFYYDVDFEIERVQAVPDPAFVEWAKPHNGTVRTQGEIAWALHTGNNCIKELRIEMRARK